MPQTESNYKRQIATNQANRNNVLRLKAEGKRVSEIMEVTDLSRASVTRFLSASRIKTRAKDEKVKGWMTAFGMSRAMALRKIEAAQAEAQVKPAIPTPAQDKSDDVLRLKAEGKKVREIVAETGVSSTSIFRILRAFRDKNDHVLRLAANGKTRTKITAETPTRPMKKHSGTSLRPSAGQLFKVNYQQGLKKLPDSEQARERIASFFEAHIGASRQDAFAAGIKRELGIDYPRIAEGHSHHGFWVKAELVDFLSAVTIFLQIMKCKPNALDGVRQIFDEEHTRYRVDDNGGVHYPWEH